MQWKAEDGIGSVELLDCMGSDLTVVNAARVSFAKESKEFSNADGKLIQYLAKHNHITPFFHPQIQFRIKMPIFVAREWYRHTIGFARNEVSRRYVDTAPECYLPIGDNIRERDTNKKQGSKDKSIEDSDYAHMTIKNCIRYCTEAYDDLLERKVAPEIARMILPQCMYTEFIETGSLAAYARLCKLRTTPDAQKEIQIYAKAIEELMITKFPVSWAALMKTD